MRNKTNTPLPATTQAPPASPIFDPRYWAPLTRAFGQFTSIIEVRDHALICINRSVHEGQLRLALVAPDGTQREPDASERQKLTVHAPVNFEEGVWIEPYHEGRWYVWRYDLARLTTIPATPATPADRQLKPAARAEESMPEPAPAVEPEPAPPSPQVEPEPPVNRGGRPTDRDLVREEASRRLRHELVPKTLAAFARELHIWLRDHGMHRAAKTGGVMKAETIEDHVRSMWKAHKRP